MESGDESTVNYDYHTDSFFEQTDSRTVDIVDYSKYESSYTETAGVEHSESDSIVTFSIATDGTTTETETSTASGYSSVNYESTDDSETERVDGSDIDPNSTAIQNRISTINTGGGTSYAVPLSPINTADIDASAFVNITSSSDRQHRAGYRTSDWSESATGVVTVGTPSIDPETSETVYDYVTGAGTETSTYNEIDTAYYGFHQTTSNSRGVKNGITPHISNYLIQEGSGTTYFTIPHEDVAPYSPRVGDPDGQQLFNTAATPGTDPPSLDAFSASETHSIISVIYSYDDVNSVDTTTVDVDQTVTEIDRFAYQYEIGDNTGSDSNGSDAWFTGNSGSTETGRSDYDSTVITDLTSTGDAPATGTITSDVSLSNNRSWQTDQSFRTGDGGAASNPQSHQRGGAGISPGDYQSFSVDVKMGGQSGRSEHIIETVTLGIDTQTGEGTEEIVRDTTVGTHESSGTSFELNGDFDSGTDFHVSYAFTSNNSWSRGTGTHLVEETDNSGVTTVTTDEVNKNGSNSGNSYIEINAEGTFDGNGELSYGYSSSTRNTSNEKVTEEFGVQTLRTWADSTNSTSEYEYAFTYYGSGEYNGDPNATWIMEYEGGGRDTHREYRRSDAQGNFSLPADWQTTSVGHGSYYAYSDSEWWANYDLDIDQSSGPNIVGNFGNAWSQGGTLTSDGNGLTYNLNAPTSVQGLTPVNHADDTFQDFPTQTELFNQGYHLTHSDTDYFGNGFENWEREVIRNSPEYGMYPVTESYLLFYKQNENGEWYGDFAVEYSPDGDSGYNQNYMPEDVIVGDRLDASLADVRKYMPDVYYYLGPQDGAELDLALDDVASQIDEASAAAEVIVAANGSPLNAPKATTVEGSNHFEKFGEELVRPSDPDDVETVWLNQAPGAARARSIRKNKPQTRPNDTYWYGFGKGYWNRLNPWNQKNAPVNDWIDQGLLWGQKTLLITGAIAGGAAVGLAGAVAVGVPGAAGFAATKITIGGAIGFLVKETGELVIESTTGIPMILGPDDIAEWISKGLLKRVAKEGGGFAYELTEQGAKAADDLAEAAAKKRAAEQAAEEARRKVDSLQESMDNVLSGTQKGRKTKGPTKLLEKSGGFEQAKKDFDSLPLNNKKVIETPDGPVEIGTLPDGRTVKLRNFSTDGRPTLEIRNPSGKRGTEIRYD
ncbi:hypothetical protein V22_24950 [Calycomorphotria hydatis]|uniref:Uncharacterized protein n=1 Tax=Calycomorphotria hydatis TaxID=2528027 RepID=A0A517TA50_9PLAN|nr:hypothetical protein V22_24950 [Calycomorphotria hydatis]